MTVELPTSISRTDNTVMVARERGRHMGPSYAKANAPTSPLPELTGNDRPGHSPLSWLKNRNKCNQFVGDVLTLAGFAMPTFRMRDGSKHFMHAEALLDQTRYFKRVGREAAPGDLLIIDRPGRGENSAHVEIVTSVQASQGTPTQLSTIAALEAGVTERERTSWFRGAKWIEAGGYFQLGAVKAFFLRPFARREH